MGLFDFIAGTDPSSDWIELGKHPVLVSVADLSVNGLRLGGSANAVSKLGRPSNKRPFKERRFHFKELGVIVEIEDDAVSYFGLPLTVDAAYDDVDPCEFKLRFAGGHEIEVNATTEAASILENLPEPSETNVDSDETIYVIPVRDYLLELEVSPSGKMQRLNFFPVVVS